MQSTLVSDSRKSTRNAGFTLLEVLISMAILVFISFSIYQATVETYELRDVLSTEGNFYNGIRLSTMIMQRDIALIYSPLISVPEKPTTNNPQTPGGPGNPQQPPQNPSSPYPSSGRYSDDLGLTTTFWLPGVDETGLRPSHFIGTENKMSFITVSHSRIYRDSPDSDFAKITYEIRKDDKSKDGTYVLVKTESPNAFVLDDTRDTLSRSYELLHGIKSLNYAYYQREGNTWKILRSWDSEKEDLRNRFPDVIELKMDVVGPKNLIFEGRYKFRPEIPLNGLYPST